MKSFFKDIGLSNFVIGEIVSLLYGFGLFIRPLAQETGGDASIHYLLLSLVLSFILGLGIAYVISRIAKIVSNSKVLPMKGLRRRFEHWYQGVRFPKPVILFLCWLPWALIKFPGNVDYDTYAQLSDFNGITGHGDHHPWFDTIIFGLFFRFGDFIGSHEIALFIYVMLQFALTASVFGIILDYLSKLGLPDWINALILVFGAFYPVMPMFAQTMTKDSLFAWIWVLFLIELIEIVRTRGDHLTGRWDVARLLILCCLMMLTKKTGIYLVVLSSIVAFVWIRRNRVKFISAVLASVVLFAGLWSSVLLPAMNVRQGPSREMLMIPISQTMRDVFDHYTELSDKDWETLGKVFSNPKDLGKQYDPIADQGRTLWKEDSTWQDRFQYLKLWAKRGIEHPMTYLIAASTHNLPAYYPDTNVFTSSTLMFYEDSLSWWTKDAVANQKVNFLHGNSPDRVYALTDVNHPNFLVPVSNWLTAITKDMMRLFPLFFMKVVFLLWLPLLALACGLYRRQRWIVVALIPFFVYWLTLIAAPLILPRYMYPVVCSAPLLIGLMFCKDKTF